MIILKRRVSLLFFRRVSRVSQPVSSYNELIETNFVVPETILAASVWIFVHIMFSCCVQLFQTTSQYSSIGLIKEIKIVSNDLRSNKNLNLRTMLIHYQAFSLMYSISLWHVQSFGMCKRRCL